MKKMKMRTKMIIAFAVAVLMTTASVVTIMNTEYAVENNEKSTKKVVKPGQVKGLKKVKMSCKWDGHANLSSVKISFKKIKGATGYQVLIYQGKVKGHKTPLVYAKNTKKTVYTIKNLAPSQIHTIKVRAYTKGKNGKITYGKASSIKVKTSGQMKGIYYVCRTCVAYMPGNMNRMAEHGESVDKVHHELHAGGSYFWK